MAQRRVAVIPVVKRKNKSMVCFITSRTEQKWILPTGKHEKHLPDEEVACIEAFEEAGVSGKLVKSFCKSLKVTSPSGRKKRKVTFYLIEVSKTHKNWPEEHQRKRKLVEIEQLTDYIDNKKLRKLIIEHA